MVKILDRGWIQSGDRFIQDQKLFGGAECPRDQNALLLSAGEFPVAFLLQMLNTQSFQIVGCQLPLCPGLKRTVSTAAQGSGQHNLLYRSRKILLGCSLLRKIADAAAL